MGFKDSRFIKPRKEDKDKPTRHLYISGIGEDLKTNPLSVRAFLLSFGELDESGEGENIEHEAIYMPEGKRYIFVTFKSLESSVCCHNYLLERGAIPDLQVSRIIARFATLAGQQGPTEPECTSLTKEVSISGLDLVPDFVTEQEEVDLLAEFDDPCKWKQTLNRRVQQYGFPFNYRTLMIDYSKPTPPLTPSLIQLAEKICTFPSNDAKNSEPINQLTINEYLPGQGIASHVDTEICFGSSLFLLSLGSGIVMTFNQRESETEENRRKYLYLPRRSLLVLTGTARYDWLHGISPRKFDKVNGHLIRRERRISFTFRHVIRPGAIPTNRLSGGTIEKEHVVDVYDAIAVHWNHTRGKRKVHWLRVKEFIESLPPGTVLADVGSGDGKYFGLNPGIISIGCDRSLQLLRVSQVGNSEHETFCCDAVVLPLLSNSFDAVICIAVLHHLSTIERRYAVICELLRIVRYGGTVFVQAWALEQESDSKRVFETQDTMVPWKLNKRFIVSDPDSVPQVQEGKDEIIYERYCHVYREGELEDLCSRVPDCQIVESGYERGNWFIRLLKVRDHRLVAEKSILNEDQQRKGFSVPTTVMRLTSNESSGKP